MKIFKNKAFFQWAKAEGITDQTLIKAVQEMKKGIFEANLGGGIYKKRIPLEGRGKRGGARTIIAFKMHNKAIFTYGYAKNDRSSITDKEEKALKLLAKKYFGYDDEQIARAIKAGEIIEVLS